MRYFILCFLLWFSWSSAEEASTKVATSASAPDVPTETVTSAKERATPISLNVGYFSPLQMNRAIGDALCLQFELLDSQYKCDRAYIDPEQRKDGDAQQYEMLILSESEYNQDYATDYDLFLPLYHKSFVAVTHSTSELSIFDQEQTFGVLNTDNQVEKIINIFQLLGVKKEMLDIGAYRATDLLDDFCNFDVDVVFAVSIHPDSFIRNLNTACDAEIQSFTEALPKQFFQRNRYLYKTTIPKEYYWRIDQDIETLSERYFLAVKKDYDETLLKSLMDNLLEGAKKRGSTTINLQDILDNYHNTQTPLNALGNHYIEMLMNYQKDKNGNGESSKSEAVEEL